LGRKGSRKKPIIEGQETNRGLHEAESILLRLGKEIGRPKCFKTVGTALTA